jgi:radical SAM protein with 4Fe4S-binding SPASM domain
MIKKILNKLIVKSGINQKFFVYLYRLYFNIINYIKYKDPYMFRIVAIEISSYCNRKCSYCPVSKETEKIPKMFMEMNLFKKIIKQLQDINFSGSIMYHFYNEPLLDERLPEFISYVDANLPKCNSRVFTSGDFLTPHLADSLFDSGLHDIVVTDHNLKPGRVEKRIAPILQKYGDRISMNRLYDRPILNRGGAIELPDVKLEKKRKGNCTVVWEELNITYTGDVLLCSSDYHRSKVYGNVNEKNILDIYNNDEYVKARKAIISGVPYYDICVDCNYFQ